jgi:hypothetical protein
VLRDQGAAEENGVDVNLAGGIRSEELLGKFESFDLDGEQIFFQFEKERS